MHYVKHYATYFFTNSYQKTIFPHATVNQSYPPLISPVQSFNLKFLFAKGRGIFIGPLDLLYVLKSYFKSYILLLRSVEFRRCTKTKMTKKDFILINIY